jgi:hypothetical protein
VRDRVAIATEIDTGSVKGEGRRAEKLGMQLTFEVDGQEAEFRRSAVTGRSELQVGEDVTCLESPYRFTTHFNLRKKTVWNHRVGDHQVEIVKVRPGLLGGFRANSFTVSVDDHVVTESHGH